ncbi:acyl-CoA dehydrogenase family protein [Aeropyrum camini]|uniref:acyl-CoA dehydrogenase family protein n=1 Tax=Aeropyrum camini TaxID=229980 RepID=UPI0007886A41|nr:acyl-CoA dehydrogenase family protein [Aeropyrum camini]
MYSESCLGPGASRLLDEELAGLAGDIDRENRVPSSLLDKAAAEGLFDIESVECLLQAVRRASRYSRGFAHVLLVHGSCRLAAGGEGRIYALGITEAGGGTDVRANITTRADELGNGSYRLEGMKYFTSNALYATHFVVLATAGGEPGLFLCERQPQIRVEPLDLSGFRGSGVGKVFFGGAVCERLTEPGVDGVRVALGYITSGGSATPRSPSA